MVTTAEGLNYISKPIRQAWIQTDHKVRGELCGLSPDEIDQRKKSWVSQGYASRLAIVGDIIEEENLTDKT